MYLSMIKKHVNDDLITNVFSHRYILVGGASRDRTDDPLLAKQMLSQLSYGPL